MQDEKYVTTEKYVNTKRAKLLPGYVKNKAKHKHDLTTTAKSKLSSEKKHKCEDIMM